MDDLTVTAKNKKKKQILSLRVNENGMKKGYENEYQKYKNNGD